MGRRINAVEVGQSNMSHLLRSQKLRHVGLPLNWVLDSCGTLVPAKT